MRTMEELIILPYPKKITYSQYVLSINESYHILIQADGKEELMPVAVRLKQVIYDGLNLSLPIYIGKENKTDKAIAFQSCSSIPDEGYRIYRKDNELIIEYGNKAGAFYAVSTLKQIFKNHSVISFDRIEDEPDFKIRGIMLDISRNKIPTMKTLCKLIDIFADLKINHLQLYIEGFSFAYPSFPEVWKDGTPVTGEEIIELDKYCKDRMIELVPNQNSFGHMTSWLEREEFNHLAESKEGYVNAIGLYEPPGTLNPLDPRTIAFIENLYDDILPYFTSKLFNVGLDEPYDLGTGKSQKACEQYGKGRVYLDFLLKINELVQKKGKKMMFWGDIIINYPELIKEIPKDTVILEWGYEEEHPFKEHCKQYKEAGIPFYVCPGTSSWKSILGRTTNMKNNLKNAAINGKELGAEGFLITDWGDYGHWQYLPISYPAFVYGAALSWNVKNNIDVYLDLYLDTYIFHDKSRLTAKTLQNLGNYYLFESCKAFNSTATANTLLVDINNMKPLEGQTIDVFLNIRDYVNEVKKDLELIQSDFEDAALVKRELQNACQLILHGTQLAKLKFMIASKDTPQREFILEMINNIDKIMKLHKELWLERNRPGGLYESLTGFEKLKNQYINLISGRRMCHE